MIDIHFAPKVAGESKAAYYQRVSQIVTERYGLKNIGFMQQLILSQDVFYEDRMNEESDPDVLVEYFAGIIPLISNPIVAQHALDRYRQYVKQREGKAIETATAMPEADAVFQRIIEPYRGNTLFIHFWGMTCKPCRAEMLGEREKVEQMKDQPVRFLYICDEKESPRERTEKWLNENNIKGEHIFLKHEEWLLLNAKLQFNATPFSIVVDSAGNIKP